MLINAGLLAATLLLSALLCRFFLQPDSTFYVADTPNHRSLHDQETPRNGGLAMLITLVVMLGLAVWLEVLSWDGSFWAVAAGVVLLASIGLLDDLYNIPSIIRLLIQFLAAVLLLSTGWTWPHLPLPGNWASWSIIIAYPITLLYIVWMTNLYNFMDGMDGFAGGMAVIGFLGLAALGWQAGHAEYALLNGIIASSAGGFLIWNFPPAKLFMGDTGSLVLGFLVAVMTLQGVALDIFPLWLGLLLFSPFIVDASWTLGSRLVRGEKVWQAHREHLYQQLVLLGWGHKRTVLWAYFLMTVCLASGLVLSQTSIQIQWAGFIGWILLYWGIIRAVNRGKLTSRG